MILNKHLKTGFLAMFGYWITLFVMEWIVFRGFGLPDQYVFRVWAFADLLGDGAWEALIWLRDYKWLAGLIDYTLEGLIALAVVATLSYLASKDVHRHLAGFMLIWAFLAIWTVSYLVDGALGLGKVLKEVARA